MRLTHYPGFDIHKKQHQELMQQVDALQQKVDKEKVAISFELLHFLKNWLVQHIIESDKRFGLHFQKVGLVEYAKWSGTVEKTMKKKKWWWKFW